MQSAFQRCLLFAALALAAHAPVEAARNPALRAVSHAEVAGPANHTGKPSDEDVKQLRRKLEVVLSGLKDMVTKKDGALARAKVAPAMTVFVNELEVVLANTSSAKDPAAAMAKLKDASAGLRTLMHELTARQEELMMEDEAQHESLLLGVLMSKQGEPAEKQRKVLQSPDFASLPVSKALLASDNRSVPLYAQAADFLDKHSSKRAAVEHKAAAMPEKMAAALQKRVQSMEGELRAREASHTRRAQLLAQRAKTATSEKERHLAETLRKQEERGFKKLAAIRSRDIADMKKAVEAVRHGDIAALESARAAMLSSLQSLKSQHGGFLVLLNLGHRTLGGDCPYCAAQCIDKCRQLGKSYASCLGDCAEAGKAF